MKFQIITLLYFVSRVFPKVSFKRKATVFIISLLMLVDDVIWADLSLIKVIVEGSGSISVDITPIFNGFIIILSFNLFIKGFNLFNKGKIR